MRTLASIIFVFINIAISFSQSPYIPFPTEDGVWRTLQSRRNDPTPNTYGTERKTITYFMYGDTILNNKSYNKLYSIYTDSIPNIPATNEYLGAFREADKVIYYQPKWMEVEKVLYDFNIEIGDTVATIFDDVSTQIDILLAATDSIQTNDNQFRKRYHLRASYNFPNETDFSFSTWVEGIGDVNKGFLSFPEAVSPFDGFDAFQCFSINENLIYQNENIVPCYINETTLDAVDYAPLVIENATWILFNSREDFTITDYSAFKIREDTIIGDKVYKKVYYYELEKIGVSKFQIVNQSLAGILRENISTRKVYGQLFSILLGGGEQAECGGYDEDQLFFDFNKKVGEKFSDCHALTIEDEFNFPISKDTIVELYGQYRRTLQGGQVQLIEGVGYNGGLFITPMYFTSASFGYGIFDYCIDSNFKCNLLTNTNEPLPQKISLSPNPASRYLNLQFQQNSKGNTQLITTTGQIIYEGKLEGLHYQIDVSGFPEGLYFLRIEGVNFHIVKKVIIE